MSEAEKKWREWASNRVRPNNSVVTGSITFGIKAYKAALRREIEKKRRSLKKSYPNFPPAFSTKEIFEIIDTVEP